MEHIFLSHDEDEDFHRESIEKIRRLNRINYRMLDKELLYRE